MTRNKSFDGKRPTLYLIATPIGNLKEMSPRALETISEMDIIAAEDTRNAFSLLANFGLKKEFFSLREHNEVEASKHLLEKIRNGKKVAYMSDAGYPGILHAHPGLHPDHLDTDRCEVRINPKTDGRKTVISSIFIQILLWSLHRYPGGPWA